MATPPGYVDTGNVVNCPECGGLGHVTTQLPPDSIYYAVQCPTCGGTGKVDEIAPA